MLFRLTLAATLLAASAFAQEASPTSQPLHLELPKELLTTFDAIKPPAPEAMLTAALSLCLTEDGRNAYKITTTTNGTLSTDEWYDTEGKPLGSTTNSATPTFDASAFTACTVIRESK